MSLFNIYIFNRLGSCVYYDEYLRTKPAASLEDEQNLIYGMLYSFKMFVQKTSPKPELETNGFRYFRTTAYKLHYFETASGFRLVLNTQPNVPDLRAELKKLYTLLVDHVIKNPEYTVNDKIDAERFGSFVAELGQFLKQAKLVK